MSKADGRGPSLISSPWEHGPVGYFLSVNVRRIRDLTTCNRLNNSAMIAPLTLIVVHKSASGKTLGFAPAKRINNVEKTDD